MDGHPLDPISPLHEPVADNQRDRALSHAASVAARIAGHMKEAILGRDDVIELVTIALFAGGHVLLEDYPGSGKTVLARALGQAIESGAEHDRMASFRRIQFTPDLLPSDITGVSVFEPDRGTFQFMPGPVFAHVVLADEINRTSPKVQSALLEAMAERQVTVDNVTHPLDELFLVLATQNPLGLAGTFPLPAPQLDRFLFKIRMEHIDRQPELEVVASFRKRLRPVSSSLPQVHRDEIVAARRALEDHVFVSRTLQECLVDIARAVRDDERVAQGISTRALVQAVPALQCRALLHQRDFIGTEDLEALLVPLFAHRLALAPGVPSAQPVLRESARDPLEHASRSTLRRSG
ncbi:MAG: AAA family ATPase [Acidobacteriota bacterium]|nr:MAG: AAA family ATPase [Acidobacteriota bacterium]